jgi:hypothetical protein
MDDYIVLTWDILDISSLSASPGTMKQQRTTTFLFCIVLSQVRCSYFANQNGYLDTVSLNLSGNAVFCQPGEEKFKLGGYGRFWPRRSVSIM